MAAPWEQYQEQEAAGPWSQYQTPEASPEPVVVQQAEEPGFFKQAAELITGSERATEQTEELPELAMSGLLAGSDMLTGVKVVPAILTAGSTEEIANILTSNYPEIGIQQDRKGNMIAYNNKTGKRAVINKPGFSTQDAASLLGLGSFYAMGGPLKSAGQKIAGKAAAQFPAIAQRVAQAAEMPIGVATELIKKYPRISALIGGSAGAAAGTAALEAGHEAVGGEFNLENVLIDAAAGGVLDFIPAALKAGKSTAEETAETLTREAVEAEAARAGQLLSPEVQGAQQTELLSDLVSAARDPEKLEKLRAIPSDIAQDPKIIKAAEDLGIGEVPPSWASTNDQYIEFEQGLTSVIGSDLSKIQKEKIRQVNQTADDLITDFGGTKDKAGLSEKIKTDILGTIDGLSDEAEGLYTTLREKIPANTAADLTNLREGILAKAAELHPTDVSEGIKELGPLETKLLKMTDGQPTYALIDRERKAIGEAQRKAAGPYQNEAEGNLKYLYGLLSEDQEKVAQGVSQEAANLWNTAKGMVLKRKDIEKKSIFLLGKNKTAAIIPKLGAATKKLSAGDYKAFDDIMDAMPAHLRQEAVITSLNDAFVSSGKRQKQLSFNDFNKWMEGLDRNRSAKVRIMKHLPPKARTRLKTINTLTKGIERATKERVTTGRIDSLLKPFESDGLIEKVYGTTKKAVEAVPGGQAVTGKLGVVADVLMKEQTPLIQAADKLLASPQFQNALIAQAETNVRAAAKRAAALKALERSVMYRKWFEALPSGKKAKIGRVGVMTYLTGEDL